MLYTLFLTAAACAVIIGVMALVYGTVRWMQNTHDVDVFEELGGSVLEITQALSAAEHGLSSLSVDASACVKKRPV